MSSPYTRWSMRYNGLLTQFPPALREWMISLLLITATVVWLAISGKDMNFDQLTYHFYLPFQFLNDRLSQDFMAANGSSYLNPLAYIPFYAMVRMGWHSLAVASVLAAFHGLNIVLAYRITVAALDDDSAYTRVLGLFGAVFAFVSPVFLMAAGTTFADVTTSVFVLAGILLILRDTQQPSAWWLSGALWAGVCLGAASGLKLSNVIFVPPCILLLLCLQPSLRRAFRNLLAVASGGFAGLLAVHGYWGWRLWKEFGNPFFPMFNNIFKSPDYHQLGAPHERFLPDSFLDAITLPFRMVQIRSWVYIEHMAPDLRFAVITLLLIALAAVIAYRKLPIDYSRSRKAVALFACFLVAFSLWVWTSSNGRYGIVVSILCGPILVLLLEKLIRPFGRAPKRTTCILLTSILALQLAHFSNGQARWTAEAWTKSWHELSIPERLKYEPYLYLSVGSSSNSYIFPYLAPDSAFSNPIGYVSFELDGPGGERLQSLFEKYQGRVRILSLAPSDDSEDGLRSWTRSANSMISRFGYQLDTGDCLNIETAGVPPESGQDFDSRAAYRRILRTCALEAEPFKLTDERRRIKALFEKIVDWCPKLFKPAYTIVERTPDGWFSGYPVTDSNLLVKGSRIFSMHTGASADIYLGTVDSWTDGQRPNCDSLPDKPRKTYTFD